MDNKELIAELLRRTWMVNCEMRGLIPDDTAHRAAQTIAAQDAHIAELEAEVERLLAAQEANEFICRSCFRRHDPPREPVAF
jgi:hypothetical protein